MGTNPASVSLPIPVPLTDLHNQRNDLNLLPMLHSKNYDHSLKKKNYTHGVGGSRATMCGGCCGCVLTRLQRWKLLLSGHLCQSDVTIVG